MEVMKYLESYVSRIEAMMDRFVPESIEPEVLAKATRHLLKVGGKRLRPCLALVACEAVGGRAEDAIEAAAALELLHTFTLIHDDIMDKDEFRRNVKTVHTIWGEPVAIIAGDALFAKVFEAVAANAKRLKLPADRVVELFHTVSKASFEICQGQALDMLFEERKDIGEREYLKMVSGKTGALIEASTKIGALLGGGRPEQVRALAEYGRLIGVAFQIHDDVLGLVGEEKKFGKPIGSDIRAGKRTLIIVRALKAAPSSRRKIASVLGKRKASKAEIKAVIEVLKETGAIDHAAKKARELVARAKSRLDVLPDSKAKQFLLELADFTVEREF
jgi:geranylgeranyl diphosphate synthase type I